MPAALNRLMLYVRDVQASAAFYQRHFGFLAEQREGDRVIELRAPQGGATLLLHPAAKSVKTGQVTVKLVFDVEDVEAFKAASLAQGLAFGTTHPADGYCFANAKDPDGNSLSISSRAFAKHR